VQLQHTADGDLPTLVLNTTTGCLCPTRPCRTVGLDSSSGADLELVDGYLQQLLPALAGASADASRGKLLRHSTCLAQQQRLIMFTDKRLYGV
jgi:hypothetical protein